MYLKICCLLTWSMMFVSAENLLRICPKGVMSKNLERDDITTFFFFLLWHLKGHVTRRRKSNRRRRSRHANRELSQVQSLTGNSQVLCGDLCLWSLHFLLWEYVNIFFTSSDSHNILKARWASWSLPAASSSILIYVTVFGVKAAKKDKDLPKHDSEKMQSFGSYS